MATYQRAARRRHLRTGDRRQWKDLVRADNGHLFIARRGGGVAVSEDQGATWTAINSGLLDKDAKALLLADAENMYVGTKGGSVFKTRLMHPRADV
jgi:carbamate kinase